MINKVVGYGGFKSYAQQPYPTIKQGKELQLKNEVWSSTKRDTDHIHPLDNYNHYHSLYKKSHLQNTLPADYHPEHVVRGANSTLNFPSTKSNAIPYDKVQADRNGQSTLKEGSSLLKTGVEHWKTNYQGSVCEPAQLNRTLNPSSFSQNSQMRSQSSGKALAKGLVDQQLAKATSYKNRPYINDAPSGITDYRFNFGQKIGSHPLELLNSTTRKQPIRDHPLKHGTNQLWTQIPGYQGFKPSQIQIEELKAKIEGRSSIEKGSNKLNLAENYHVNIPGYAGYKPRVNVAQNQFRESCFSYKNS